MTPKLQQAESLRKAIKECAAKGWKHVSAWIFLSPQGTRHDLSAADLTKLNYITENSVFVV